MNFVNAGISFHSTLEAAHAQAANLRYNAAQADINAQTTAQESVAADEALARAINKSMGTAHAQYGASGVDQSTGSPLEVLADATRQGTLDRLTQQHNYTLQKIGYQDQAKLYRIGATNATQAGLESAIANGLSAMGGGSGGSSVTNWGGAASNGAGTSSSSVLNGGQYTGPQSVSWPGSAGGQWSGGNSLTGGTYTGDQSQSTSWPGSGGSWM